MSEPGADLPWTCEQWATVQRTAVEAARKARVASSFLPLVGPLPEGQASVPAAVLQHLASDAATAAERLEVDDGVTLKLATLSCEVFVSTQQASDPELASVLQMVSRAAVVIGRLEDAIVLMGQPGPYDAPAVPVGPPIFRVQGGQATEGLQQLSARIDTPGAIVVPFGDEDAPDLLVAAVVAAIDQLEGLGHYGPFGAFFGHSLYEIAHMPSVGTLVMPSDRFVPFLGGGPLLRSSVLPKMEGLVVSTAGAPIDLVVGTDVHVSFLQRTTEPRYVLRVSERVVLRVKEPDAVAHIVMAPAAP